MISKVIPIVTSLLKQTCKNVFTGKSAVIYPKINFDISEISNDSFKTQYRLTIDVFTNGEGPSETIALTEKAAATLSYSQVTDDQGGLVVFGVSTGGGFAPSEKDERIIHVFKDFTVTYYKNRDC